MPVPLTLAVTVAPSVMFTAITLIIAVLPKLLTVGSSLKTLLSMLNIVYSGTGS